jgi:dsDNA-specific endonuclease/ATPase MutS2
MRHFECRLNNALTHNYVEVTFIHGVGTGKLKAAIRAELKEYGLQFIDGPFHKYGVGATVVQLT